MDSGGIKPGALVRMMDVHDDLCLVIETRTDRQLMRSWDKHQVHEFAMFMDEHYGQGWLDDIANTRMLHIMHPSQGMVWIAESMCECVSD